MNTQEPQVMEALLKVFEDGATKESAKHALEYMDAKEIREVLLANGRAIMKEFVESLSRELSRERGTITREDVLNAVVDRAVKHHVLSHWDIEDARKKIVGGAAALVIQNVSVEGAMEIVRSERAALLARCHEVLASESSKLLVDQAYYWKGRVEDLLERVKRLEDPNQSIRRT